MKPVIEEFILKSRQTANLQELCGVFETAIFHYGFNQWAYQLINASHEKDKKPLIFANYPEEWVTHYIEKGYHKVDPVIIQGPTEIAPFLWSGLAQKNGMTNIQKNFYQEAVDYGLPDGLGIPVHGGNGAFAMVSMAASLPTPEFTRMTQDNILELHLISLIFHGVAKDLISLDMLTGPKVEFTQREKDCLTWVASGKTAWETGEILHISETTVKYFLANARTKLGVYSTREAIVKAYMMGLIRP